VKFQFFSFVIVDFEDVMLVVFATGRTGEHFACWGGAVLLGDFWEEK